MHEHHGHGVSPAVGVAVGVAVAAAVVYLLAAARSGPRGWSAWRSASWLGGCAVVALAFLVSGEQTHMLRHVLLGMVAPLGLVLGAPVTLFLRTAGPRPRRLVVRVLRSRVAHVLGHPVAAGALSVGGMYAVLLTPLHDSSNPLLYLHYLAAGYLFTWSIAGPDPAPRRPGFGTRLVVLVLAAAAHAVLAKFLYAAAADDTGRDAALLMYYGGDVAEVLLTAALFRQRFGGRLGRGAARLRGRSSRWRGSGAASCPPR